MPSAYLLLVAAIAAEITGTTFLQKSEQFTKAGPTIMTALAFALSFFTCSAMF